MEAITLKTAIDAAGYVPISYSGRGMYGRSCVAFTCENERMALMQLGRQIALDAVDMPRLDTMGHDWVIYWPYVNWE